MNIMRVNYTNVGIAVSLLAVCFIFFKLAQRSHLVTSQAKTSELEASIVVDTRLKKAQETIDSLKRELSEARRAEVKTNRMELDKRKFSGHKLVHLDLKGAPTKMDYLIKVSSCSTCQTIKDVQTCVGKHKLACVNVGPTVGKHVDKLFVKLEILPHFAKWGATGLLVEYEDVFPYKETYKVLRAKNSYGEEEIKHFLEAAKENDLMIIPLVQTFGHLEFVLKHKEFAHLRETEHFTNSLCPNNKESIPMVVELIDQVLALHPGINWFHIGGDEVWNLKTCSVCMKDERNASQLFVHHMTPILKHLKTKDVTPIMWDDMMRMWPVKNLKELGSLVEPMVWAYRSDLTGYFPPGMWQRYGEAFKKIWAASAFKGATFPWSNFVPVGFHVQNNLNWLDIISKLPGSLEMNGIALTGWSRYDHYGTLCELLPAALPSLAYCLQALRHGYMDEELRKSTAEELGLPETFPLNVGRFNERYHPPDGSFPGHKIFKLVGEMEKAVYDERGVHNIEQGWILDRQTESKFLSYYQMESAHNKTVHGLKILATLQKEAETVLSPVYDDFVVREWVKDKIDSSIHHLNSKKTNLDELRKVAAASE